MFTNVYIYAIVLITFFNNLCYARPGYEITFNGYSAGCKKFNINFPDGIHTDVFLSVNSSSLFFNTKFIHFKERNDPYLATIIYCAKYNQQPYQFSYRIEADVDGAILNHYKYVGSSPIDFSSVSLDTTSSSYERILNDGTNVFEDRNIDKIQVTEGSKWWFGDLGYTFLLNIEGYIKVARGGVVVKVKKGDDSIVWIKIDGSGNPTEERIINTEQFIPFTSIEVYTKIHIKFLSTRSHYLTLDYQESGSAIYSPLLLYKLDIDYNFDETITEREIASFGIVVTMNVLSSTICVNENYGMSLSGIPSGVVVSIACSSVLVCNKASISSAGESSSGSFKFKALSAVTSLTGNIINLSISAYSYVCTKIFSFYVYEVTADDSTEIQNIPLNSKLWDFNSKVELTDKIQFTPIPSNTKRYNYIGFNFYYPMASSEVFVLHGNNLFGTMKIGATEFVIAIIGEGDQILKATFTNYYNEMTFYLYDRSNGGFSLKINEYLPSDILISNGLITNHPSPLCLDQYYYYFSKNIGELVELKSITFENGGTQLYEGENSIITWDFICVPPIPFSFSMKIAGDTGFTVTPTLADLTSERKIYLKTSCDPNRINNYEKNIKLTVSGTYSSVLIQEFEVRKGRLIIAFPNKNNMVEGKNYSISITTQCPTRTPAMITGVVSPIDLVEMINSPLIISEATTYMLWFNAVRNPSTEDRVGTIYLNRSGDALFTVIDPPPPNIYTISVKNSLIGCSFHALSQTTINEGQTLNVEFNVSSEPLNSVKFKIKTCPTYLECSGPYEINNLNWNNNGTLQIKLKPVTVDMTATFIEFIIITESLDLDYNNIESQKYRLDLVYEKPLVSIDLITDCINEGETYLYNLKYQGYFIDEIKVVIACTNSHNPKETLTFTSTIKSIDYPVATKIDFKDKTFTVTCLFNITSLDTRFIKVDTKSKTLNNIDRSGLNLNRLNWKPDLVYNEKFELKVSLSTIPESDVKFTATSDEILFTPMIFSVSNWNIQQVQEYTYKSPKAKILDIFFRVESLDTKYSAISLPKHTLKLYPHVFITNMTVQPIITEYEAVKYYFHLSQPPTSEVIISFPNCGQDFFCSDPTSYNQEFKMDIIFTPNNYNEIKTIKIQAIDNLIYSGSEYSKLFHINIDTTDVYYKRIMNIDYYFTVIENDYPQISVSYQEFLNGILSGTTNMIKFSSPLTPLIIIPVCSPFLTCSNSVAAGNNIYNMIVTFPLYNDTAYSGKELMNFTIESTNPGFNGVKISPFMFNYVSTPFDVVVSYSFDLPLKYETSGLVYYHLSRKILTQTQVIVNCTILRCETETVTFTPQNVFVKNSIRVYNDMLNNPVATKGDINFYIEKDNSFIKRTHEIELESFSTTGLTINTKSRSKMFTNEYSDFLLSLSSKPLGNVRLRIISDDIKFCKLGLPIDYINISPDSYSYERLITFATPHVAGEYRIVFSLTSTDTRYIFDKEYIIQVYEQYDILFDNLLTPLLYKGDSITIPISLKKTLDGSLSIFLSSSSTIALNPTVIHFNSANYFKMQKLIVQTTNDLSTDIGNEKIGLTTSVPGYLPSDISLVLLPTIKLQIVFDIKYLYLNSSVTNELGIKLSSQPFQSVEITLESTYSFISYSPNSLLFTDSDYDVYQFISVQLLIQQLPYDGFYLNLISFKAQSVGVYNRKTETINGYAFKGYYGFDLSPVVSSAILYKNVIKIKFSDPVLIESPNTTLCETILTQKSMIQIGSNSSCIISEDSKLITIKLISEETSLKYGDSLQFIYGKISKIENPFFSVVESFEITNPETYSVDTATFDSKGSAITLTFSSPISILTDGFQCTSLFSNDNLGSGCLVETSGDHLIINLGHDSTIKPSRFSNICEKDSTIHLIDRMLFFASDEEKYFSGSKSVNYAKDPDKLNPIIQGPKFISDCEGLINFHAEYRFNKNAFEITYSWSISSDGSIDDSLINYVRSISTPLLQLPKSNLTINQIYKLELEVFGRFNHFPEKASTTIEVKPISFPTIRLNKPKEYKARTSDTLDIHPILGYSYCYFEEIPIENFSFEWISDFDIAKYINNDKLLIPPHSILPYSTLRVDLIVKLLGEIIFNDYVNIEIVSLPFKYSLPPHITLNTKDTLMLDASSTEDPDDIDPPFIFNWICNSCPPFRVEGTVIIFNSNTFEPNRDYELQLDTRNKIKTFKYNIMIKTTSEGPSIWIEGKLYDVLLYIEFSAIAKSLETNLTYEWSIKDHDDSIIEGKYSDKIIVSPYFLESGTIFYLNLKAKNLNNEETHYQLILSSVFYPANGFIDVYPKSGFALETIFYIGTYGWIGDDPLKYKYGFIISNLEFFFTPEFIDEDRYSTILPSQIGGNRIEIVVYIKSRYGIIARCSELLDKNKAFIEVLSNVNTTDQLKEKVNELMNGSPLSNSIDTLLIGTISVFAMIPDQCNFLICGSGICENNMCKCPVNHSGINCEIINPVDGVWSEWEGYTCTLGHQVFSRECSNPKPQNGGNNCLGDDFKIEKCGTESSTEVHFSTWTNWTECSVECANQFGRKSGIQYRKRDCINAVNCGGLKFESRECSVYCPYPEKSCPGQLYENGKLMGSECSGNGMCIKSKEPCTMDDMNCKVKCECSGEYIGDKCALKQSEKELVAPMVNLLLEKVMNMSDEKGINELYCQFLSYMVLYNDIVDREIFMTSLSIVSDKINVLSTTCYDLLLGYISKLYLSVSHQRDEDMEFTSKLIELTKKIPKEIEKKLMVGESYSRDFDSFAITEKKLNNNYDSELSDNSVNVKISNKTFENVKYNKCSVEIITWKHNIYPEIENISSFIVSMSVLSNSRQSDLSELSIPITYSLLLSTKASGEKAVCQYYNKETKSYSTDGVYTLYMTNLDEDNIIIYCSTTHLSDFVTFDKSFLPKMNIVNPINDVSLLANYNSSNFLVPLVLSILFVLFIIVWVLMYIKDKKEKSSIIKEKYLSYVFKGRINSKRNKAKFWDSYKNSLTNKHLWLGAFSKQNDVFIVVTRAQRAIVLFCCILTDFAVLALFFGIKKENLGQIISSSIISGFIMLPVGLILPEMFSFANNLQSPNIKSTIDHSILQKFEDSATYKARNIFALMGAIIFSISFLMLFPIFIIFKISYLSLAFALANIIYVALSLYMLFSKSTIIKAHFMNISVISGLFTLMFLFILVLTCLPTSFFRGLWVYGKSNTVVGSICYDIETLFNCVGYNTIDDFPFHDIETSTTFIVVESLQSCKSFFDKNSLVTRILMIPYSLIYLGLFITTVIYGIMLYKKCNKVFFINGEEVNLEEATVLIQRWFRRIKHRIYIPRRKEFRTWMKEEKTRSRIIYLAYVMCVCYIFVMMFINLIYGVKFSPKQSYGWLSACGLSLLIDFLIQQVIVLL